MRLHIEFLVFSLLIIATVKGANPNTPAVPPPALQSMGVDWAVVGAVCNIIQAAGVVAGLGLLVWQVKRDHLRRKREATVHYMNEVSQYYRPLGDELTLSGREPLTENRVKEILADANLSLKARDLTGRIEHLAAGVLFDVFDLEILNKMAGGYLVNFYSQWQPYFQQRLNAVTTNPFLYDQTEELARELSSRRGLRMPTSLIRTAQPTDVLDQRLQGEPVNTPIT